MKKIYLFILCFSLFFENNIFGQTIIAIQDFETTPATPTWAFTNTGGGVSNAIGFGDTPNFERIRNGSRSFQIGNATSTIDFDNINVSAYSSVSIIVRVSSTSTNATNGADADDYVRLFTALNNGSFLTNTETNADIALKGNNNARWEYRSTGVTTTAGSNAIVAGTSGTNAGTVYSTLIINIPNGTNFVDLRIIARNNDATERWNIDDVELRGTLPTNTISAPSTPSTINLANCASTANINVNVTSTATFNAGNKYTAQLSDASGSFASPLATNFVTDNTNTPPTITLAVPAGTLTGTGYKVRVIADNPAITGAESGAFTINQAGNCASNASDYFRSKQTGNWNLTTSWESSADNISWINATLVPNATANAITIQTGHNITITDARTFDQTQINGTLTFGTNASPTIADGTGTDVTINNGGILEYNGTAMTINTIFTGTILVNTNGIIRYTVGFAGGNIAQNLAGTATNPQVVYDNGGIFEWNNTAGFGSSNVSYFSTSTAGNIPIFRITQTVSGVGANSPNNLNFNGVFEANANITFINSAEKFFRNGIRGTGTITQQANSGKLNIVGMNAELSGVTLALDAVNGLVLANNANINVNNNLTLSSGKIVFTNSTLNLNNRNLTISGGTIEEDLANNFTILDNTATTETSKGGAVIYNTTVTGVPNNFFNAGLTLSHGGTGDYAITVARRHYSGGFGKGIKRIYQITGTPSGTSVMTIRYAEAELGVITEPLSISRWQPATGWTNYTPDVVDFVNNFVTYNSVTAFSSWTLSSQNNALPIQLVAFSGEKIQKNTAKISWKTATETNNQHFTLEKSENQSDKNVVNDFVKIAQIDAQGNSATLKNYDFIDNFFEKSAYYRLIQVDKNGTEIPVSIFFLKNEDKISIEIYPNPFLETITFKGATNEVFTLNIQTLDGKNVFSAKGNLVFLENKTQNQLKNLQNGNYLFVFQNENQRIIKKITKN